ncbi:DUF2690 domain-containing protein [Streptomyces sp. NPDC056244]|uniref:DUF2690 domain-containing protein n=1 Tax=Streptomyces sp. NPDC056244 TaxID=3345762 RepID=UPI0035D7A171
MTTSDSEGSSAAAPDPAGPAPGGRRRFSLNRNAAALALVSAAAGAVAAAFLTPLAEHWINDLFDEPSCPGEACEGKNPQGQGCAEGARTFKPEVDNPALLQIRYSEDCKSVWARIQQGSPGDQVTVKVAGGTARAAEIDYDNDKFTDMAAVPDGEFQVTACAVPKAGGKSTYEAYCVHATEASAWR